jgi:hypothetical protein
VRYVECVAWWVLTVMMERENEGWTLSESVVVYISRFQVERCSTGLSREAFCPKTNSTGMQTWHHLLNRRNRSQVQCNACWKERQHTLDMQWQIRWIRLGSLRSRSRDWWRCPCSTYAATATATATIPPTHFKILAFETTSPLATKFEVAPSPFSDGSVDLS